MPAFQILVDDALIATVSTEGQDLLSVSVSGSRIDEAFACLDCLGGTHSGEGEASPRYWSGRMAIRPGQRIEMRFLGAGETDLRAAMVLEPLPAAPADAAFDAAAAFDELRAMPLKRDGFRLEFQSSSGAAFAGRTRAEDHAFSCRLAWSSHRPDRARVSLHTFTLDELEHREPLRDKVREQLQPGASLTLRIDA